MKSVTITSDGACIPNPGKGAWAFSVEGDLGAYHGKGSCDATTNNRMEMEAAIQGLLSITEPARVTLRTDSMYVIYAARRVNSKKKNRSNADLVHRLWDAMRPHTLTLEWVRGHAGDEQNELVDEMANSLCLA